MHLTHCANTGKSLAFQIENSITNDEDFTQYLNTPSLKSCKFQSVSLVEAMAAIDYIEYKNSAGHDDILNTLKFIMT